MLSKRVVACLDVKNGELSKGVQFVATEMLGDPVAKAKGRHRDSRLAPKGS